MNKVLFIILLFFSTSVYAVVWKNNQGTLANSLNNWIESEYEIVHTRTEEYSLGIQHIYTLVNSKITETFPKFPSVVICVVKFREKSGPSVTSCYTEEK